MKNKVWKVMGRKETYSDRELKKMIKEKQLTLEDIVYTDEMKEPIKLKDSIYGLYFPNEDK